MTGEAQARLWVDDLRPAPPGWDWAKTYHEAIARLQEKAYTELSLDHDLGCFEDGREYTGYDILVWLEARQAAGEPVPPLIHVHSANPVGVQRMQTVIRGLKRNQFNDKRN